MTDEAPDPRAHFGLTTLPFTREIAISDRWRSPVFEEPLSDLLTTIQHRMSAVVLAPSGAGKTVLLRALVDALPEARYRVHEVKVTCLSKREMYREIATAASVSPAGTFSTLVRRLQDRFRRLADDEGLRPVLLVDEAQDMRPEVLSTLRVLTNFDLDSRLVLSVVLAGTSQLGELLKRPDLEPVSRRMAHCATLRLLSRAETKDYVDHRLTVAGARTSPFDDQALDALYEVSRGNLRAVDHLCRKALDLAARKGAPAVDPALVVAARKSLLP